MSMKSGAYQFVLTIVVVLLPLSMNTVLAAVLLPEGQYHETTTDLTVKTPGGFVELSRTWYRGEWHFNRVWNAIEFEFDPLDRARLKTITRNGDTYERVGNGDIFVFETRYTITMEAAGFRWRDREGNWIEYNPDGRMLAYGERNGVSVSIVYDEEGRRVSVIDHNGEQVLWYEYDESNRLVAVRDADARVVAYGYSANRLATVTDSLGYETRYEYLGDNIVKKVDAAGRISQIDYSTGGQVTKIALHDGLETHYRYQFDPKASTYYVQQTSPGGRVTETWYNSDGVLMRRVVNGEARLVVTIGQRHQVYRDAAGLETRKDYDELGNHVRTLYPDGSVVSYEYDASYSNLVRQVDEDGVETLYKYDTHGNRIRRIDAAGTENERSTVYQRDALGRVTSIHRLANSENFETVIQLAYDRVGNISARTNTLGNTTSYTHDRQGNVLTETSPLGHTVTHTYDSRGRRTSYKDPLGHETRFEYDPVGNLVKVVDAGGATTYAYDARDNLIARKDPLGAVEYREYNAEDELIRYTDRAGVGTSITYDGTGRMVAVTDDVGNETIYEYGEYPDWPSRITYPTYTQEYAYDRRGRRTTSVLIPGDGTRLESQTTYDARGRRTEERDPFGRVHRREYDALGRMVSHTDPVGGQTYFTYTATDRLRTLTDPNGNTHHFAYDAEGQKTAETRPMGETTTYGYDEDGRLVEKVTPLGERIVYDYDEAGRRTAQNNFPNIDATTPDKTVTYWYDAHGVLAGYDDGTTRSVYSHDAARRKITETVDYGSFALTLRYEYDAGGRKTAYTGPDGVRYQYDYNKVGQLYQITIPGQGTISYPAYAWRRELESRLPGGVVREYTYDGLLRPTAIVVDDPAGEKLLDYRYRYDGVGNIIDRSTDHGLESYIYDDLDRLIGADLPVGGEAYTYDGVGNRLTSLEAGNWYYDANNRLLGYGNITLSYDDNGNTRQKRRAGLVDREYHYDADNRLIRVTDGSGKELVRNYFDPFARRLWKETGGIRTYFHYADEGLVGEFDERGNSIRTYGYKPSGPWGTDPVFIEQDGIYYYYHNDHLGTPQKITEASGALAWSGQYKAFGEAVLDTLEEEEQPADRPAELQVPMPGTNIDTRVVNFSWEAGVGVKKYLLYVGTTEGGKNVENTYVVGTHRIVDVPLNGGALYVTLRSLIDDRWHDQTYTFPTTSSGSDTAAQLTSPASGEVIGETPVTLQWSPGENVSKYLLYVGTTEGGKDLENTYVVGTSRVVDFPLDGNSVHVTLRSLIDGVWVDRSHVLPTSDEGADTAARLTYPAQGEVISETPVNLQWTPGENVSKYLLYVGTTEGGKDLANTYVVGTSRVVDVPLDGNSVHVTLRSLIDGVWIDRTYVLPTADEGVDTAAQLTIPVPGEVIGETPVKMQWSPGENVSKYLLYVGTTEGGKDLANTYVVGTSRVVDIPLDGNSIHVTLRSLIDGVWVDRSYVLPTLNEGVDTAAQLTSPVSGEVIGEKPVTLQWSPGENVSKYLLYVGTTEGGKDLANTYVVGTSRVVDVPLDGLPIHVTLRSLVDGVWIDRVYSFQSTMGGGDAAARITQPEPGSTLASTSVTLEWNAGADAEKYLLYVGTSPGGKDLANSYVDDLSYELEVPLSGNPIYVTLRSLLGGVWIDRRFEFATQDQ